MAEIIPAILEKSFNGLTEKLEKVLGVTRAVQIDVCDGVFVQNVSWPYTAPMLKDDPKHYDDYFKQIVSGNGEIDMPMWEDFDFELDLMIADPRKLLPDLLTIGPSRIVFHAETLNDLYYELHDIAKTIPPLIDIGVAINVNTNPEIVFKLIDEKIIKFVQCMGIDKIGFQSQPFSEKVLDNIKMFCTKYPEIPISIDGAVSLDNAKELVDAGATHLISGSAIFSKDMIADRIAEFERVIQ